MANIKDFKIQALLHLDELYSTALHMLANESDAQALVQESITMAYKFWRQCPSGANSRVWLFKIMVKAIVKKYQPSQNLSTATINSNEIEGYSENSRLTNQQSINDYNQIIFPAISSDGIVKAIGDLPEDIRLIVILSLLKAFSYRDVAAITSLDLETVRSKLHEGRDLMREGLFGQLACQDMKDLSTDLVIKRSTS